MATPKRATIELEDIGSVFEECVGQKPTRVLYPGGRSRQTVIAVTADRKAYAITRRNKQNRASLELAVMRELAENNAPVPLVVAATKQWLIQSYAGPLRLTEKLNTLSHAEAKVWLGRAIDSLVRVQEAGKNAGLSQKVARIGKKSGWLETLMALPENIATLTHLPAPEIDRAALTKALAIRTPGFIKWDARPGNAIVNDDDGITWIDWEHCGVRDPLDDLAWLLGDEWSPDDATMEGELFTEYLHAFCAERSIDSARDYLMTFGTLHMTVRLSLILSRRAKGDWWNVARALAGDKIGVTPEGARRLCLRASRWSGNSSTLQALSPWFLDLQTHIESL